MIYKVAAIILLVFSLEAGGMFLLEFSITGRIRQEAVEAHDASGPVLVSAAVLIGCAILVSIAVLFGGAGL